MKDKEKTQENIVTFKLKVKGCEKEFKEGFGKGVLALEYVDIPLPMPASARKNFNGLRYALAVNDHIKEMIEKHIEVEVEY
jgi:hypothetical protein